jgi:hypothetical protein
MAKVNVQRAIENAERVAHLAHVAEQLDQRAEQYRDDQRQYSNRN